MILKARNKRPTITFGLGKNTVSPKLGDTVLVYMQEAYSDNYYFNLETTLNYKQINRSTWDLVIDKTGVFEIKVYMTTKNKSVQRYSNTLKITV